MKKQSLITFFVVLVAVILFSAVPVVVNAQKRCRDGNCPNGQVCVNGYCEKFQPFCPPCYKLYKGECVPCRSCCMWVSAPLLPNETPSASLSEPPGINFPLSDKGPFSINIYDMTGRSVRTIADHRMSEACHEVGWDGKDDSGNVVSAGVYILQIVANGKSETLKFPILK